MFKLLFCLQVTAKSTVLALLKRSSPYNSNVDLLFTASRQRYKNPTNCRSSTTTSVTSTRTASNLGKYSIMQLQYYIDHGLNIIKIFEDWITLSNTCIYQVNHCSVDKC